MPQHPKAFRAAADYTKVLAISASDGTVSMKSLVVCALLLLAPFSVQAGCTATDFGIKDFKTGVVGGGAMVRLTLSGELVNSCATPAAAQIRIDAKDSAGNVIQSKQSWPAGTTNIAPGASTKFDLGRQFHFQADMVTYTATISAVRTW